MRTFAAVSLALLIATPALAEEPYGLDAFYQHQRAEKAARVAKRRSLWALPLWRPNAIRR